MAYRFDEGLEFLQYIDDKSLDTLVTTLTKDKDGSLRHTESITSNALYKRHSPNHSKYWEVIAEELQTFGGNSFVNVLRKGQGVLYKEILCDVCDKMKVNYNKDYSIVAIENNLFMKILGDSLKGMKEEDLREVVKGLNLKTQSFTSEAIMAALQIAIKKSGFQAYMTAVIVANAMAKAIVGRGLSFATNAALTRTIGIFAGPIGWAITGLWTAIDLAGPAYRVTIPSVIQVAFLRQQYLNKEILEEKNLEDNLNE